MSSLTEGYYYSGGNLRDFMSEESVVKDSIDQGVSVVDAQVAKILITQYTLGSDRHIDHLRMASARASRHDRKNQNTTMKYRVMGS